MSHVAYIVTDPMTVKIYLKPQIKSLVNCKWQVSVICGGDRTLLSDQEKPDGVSVYHVPMRREISPISDICSLIRLFRLLLRLHPTVVNAGTPKAGLLGMVASCLARIPVRIYQLHGLRLETATGWKRRLFFFTERVACWCSHTVLCVSTSLKDKVLQLGICEPHKLTVLGFGSCVGVRSADYLPTAEQLASAAALRKSLQIPAEARVVGFIGRLTKDKGISELLEAFWLIRERVDEAYLLLVGPFEEGDPIPEEARQEIADSPYIRHVAWTDDPRPHLRLMDVFVFPTYREGLPGVLLEATATETPIVATRATGVVDVIIDGLTGLLSPIGDVRSLADNALKILLNPPMARELSRRANRKIDVEFAQDKVLQHLELFYRELCVQSGH